MRSGTRPGVRSAFGASVFGLKPIRFTDPGWFAFPRWYPVNLRGEGHTRTVVGVDHGLPGRLPDLRGHAHSIAKEKDDAFGFAGMGRLHPLCRTSIQHNHVTNRFRSLVHDPQWLTQVLQGGGGGGVTGAGPCVSFH